MKTLTWLCAIALLSVSAVAQAADVTTVLDGLNNPCGVAIQPGTSTVFVSDSAAGRIIRLRDGLIEFDETRDTGARS